MPQEKQQQQPQLEHNFKISSGDSSVTTHNDTLQAQSLQSREAFAYLNAKMLLVNIVRYEADLPLPPPFQLGNGHVGLEVGRPLRQQTVGVEMLSDSLCESHHCLAARTVRHVKEQHLIKDQGHPVLTCSK